MMKDGRYYIFETTDEGLIKKVSLEGFSTKEAADYSIRSMCHPFQAHRFMAIRTQVHDTSFSSIRDAYTYANSYEAIEDHDM